jgi:hypothetical protein
MPIFVYLILASVALLTGCVAATTELEVLEPDKYRKIEVGDVVDINTADEKRHRIRVEELSETTIAGVILTGELAGEYISIDFEDVERMLWFIDADGSLIIPIPVIPTAPMSPVPVTVPNPF